MSISERLKLVCQEKNWKLKDFSEATGLPYRTAQGYLNGTREPNTDGLIRLHKTIKVNINWLLTGYGRAFIDDIEYGLTLDAHNLITIYNKCNVYGQKAININAVSIASENIFIKPEYGRE